MHTTVGGWVRRKVMKDEGKERREEASIIEISYGFPNIFSRPLMQKHPNFLFSLSLSLLKPYKEKSGSFSSSFCQIGSRSPITVKSDKTGGKFLTPIESKGLGRGA